MSEFSNEYTTLGTIGEGSYADVLKVRHNQMGYIRAVKVSKQMVTNEENKAYQQFLNECKLMLRLGSGCHPNIVRVYMPRVLDKKAVLEMDYVDGKTLNEYLSTCSFLPMNEVFQMTKDIVGALAYCHVDIYKFLLNKNEDDIESSPDNGQEAIIDKDTEKRLIEKYRVIHNDLHSNNIMRRNYDGSYVLLDFGLSIEGDKAVKSSARNDGALEYLAPEKWDKAAITPQTDVYSLGIILYEALAGHVPFPISDIKAFSEKERHALYTNHQQSDPPEIYSIREAAFKKVHPNDSYKKDYPDWLEDIIRKCLRKRPEDRYENAKEVYVDFMKHYEKEMDTHKTITKLEDKIEEIKEEYKKDIETRIKKIRLQKEKIKDKEQIINKQNEEIKSLRSGGHISINDIERLQFENSVMCQQIELLKI